MKVTAVVAGYSSILLNLSVQQLVVNMGTLLDTTKVNNPILETWKAFRDIANVFLVFITILIGLATIVGISSFGYKQLLFRVILAALLVNFSITIAKVVIDVSNIAALATYTELLKTDETVGTNCAKNPSEEKCIGMGISAIFWNILKLQTLLDTADDISKPEGRADIYWGLIYIGLFGSIFFLILAFILASAAFLLIGRFIVLAVLLIVSPIGLVFWITNVSSMGRQWWHTLLNQSFFAPLMFLMWWVAVKVMVGFNEVILKKDVDYAHTFAEGATKDKTDLEAFPIFLVFAISSGLLILSLVMAKKMGAKGADATMRHGKALSRRAGLALGAGAGALTVGATAYAGRKTVGRMGQATKDSEHLKRMEGGNKAQQLYAKMARSGSSKAAGASFDARGLTKSKALGSAGGKGGFTKWQEKKVKEVGEQDKRMKEYTGDKKERAELKSKKGDEDKAYKATTKMDAGKAAKENVGKFDQEIGAINTHLARTTDPNKRAELERKLVKTKKEKVQTGLMSARIKARGVLEKKLKDTNLSQEDRKKYQAKLTDTTDKIRQNYGTVDKSVAKKQAKIDALKQKQSRSNDEDAQLATLRTERNTAVEYHETKDALSRGQGTPAVLKAKQADLKEQLNQQRIANRQDIDSGTAAAWKAKGEARSARNLDRLSTDKTFGIMPTSQTTRKAVASVRKGQSMSKKERAIRDMLTAIEKEDTSIAPASGSGTPASGSGTTNNGPQNN